MPEGRRWLLGCGAALLPLTGCGFHAVYGRGGDAGGNAGGASADLAAVHVGLMPERSGQLLRLALQERLERGGAGIGYRYELRVAFALADQGIAIQQDNSITRERLIGSADFTLFGNDPARPTLFGGSARKVDGFDVIDQEFFAADQEREAVVRRIAEGVADQISLQLAAYFRRRSLTRPA